MGRDANRVDAEYNVRAVASERGAPGRGERSSGAIPWRSPPPDPAFPAGASGDTLAPHAGLPSGRKLYRGRSMSEEIKVGQVAVRFLLEGESSGGSIAM